MWGKGDKGGDRKGKRGGDETSKKGSEGTGMGEADRIFESIFGGGGKRENKESRKAGQFGDAMEEFGDAMEEMEGMFGGLDMQGGRALVPRPPPPDTVKPLELSLEELFMGAVKPFAVLRKASNGLLDHFTLNISVKPGWKAGTKIRYEGLGDDDGEGRAGDLVLVVVEKKHSRFRREGDDLVYTHAISLREALAGPEPAHDVNRGLRHLDGRRVVFKLPLILPAGGKPIPPGLQLRIPRLGMPITRNLPLKSAGDLRILIAVEFPPWLDADQIRAARLL